MANITFRIDDIGASTKIYNQYGRKVFKYGGFPIFYFPLANFGKLKITRPFRQWGCYDELTREEWLSFLKIFDEFKIKPIISVTACWVDGQSNLIPFPKKFPGQARLLREAFLVNKIVIANHGLTHCVIGRHLPRFWGSNKSFHREFWPWLDEDVHKDHILRSQDILENFFGKKIDVFVPPGNVWSIKTYKAIKNTNIRKIISNRYMLDSNIELADVEFVSDKQGFFNFHDRELKLYGEKWLLRKINYFKDNELL